MTVAVEETAPVQGEVKRVRTSNVDFIKCYNSCETVAEVAAKLGITENSVTQRRLSLQKIAKANNQVIRFKKFPRVSNGTRKSGLSAAAIADLAKLADSILGPEPVAPEAPEVTEATE